LLDRRLAEHFARQAREKADADARRAAKDAETAAALAYMRRDTESAARESAREAAEAQARQRQREIELDAAATLAMACNAYERDIGCRSDYPARRSNDQERNRAAAEKVDALILHQAALTTKLAEAIGKMGEVSDNQDRLARNQDGLVAVLTRQSEDLASLVKVLREPR
jgi:hypothetical protein